MHLVHISRPAQILQSLFPYGIIPSPKYLYGNIAINLYAGYRRGQVSDYLPFRYSAYEVE